MDIKRCRYGYDGHRAAKKKKTQQQQTNKKLRMREPSLPRFRWTLGCEQDPDRVATFTEYATLLMDTILSRK